MLEKRNNKGFIILIVCLAVLLAVIVLNFVIHICRTMAFNKVEHVATSTEESEDIVMSSKDAGTWEKEDALYEGITNGSTFDFTIENIRDYNIANWYMIVRIHQLCYLNQDWNGTVEIHQNVASGQEKVQTLDLHNFDLDYDEIQLEYAGEGKNDFMVPLYPGDYLVYYPSDNNAAHEFPLGGTNKTATIGMIFYYQDSLEMADFDVYYYFGKTITQGTEFTLFLVLSVVWVVLLIVTIVWFVMRRKAMRELRNREAMLEETLGLISSFVDAKDPYTNGHSTRVAHYTVLLAQKLKFTEHETNFAYYAAILHDIGKCYVPDEILKKPGKLTDEEYAEIKKHTVFGAEMMKSIQTMPHIAEGAKYHHERYDGKGYPEGLQGENIPLIGRLICVADSFDAMTSSRCYRTALTKEKALSELGSNKGKQFDPVIAEAMIELINEGAIHLTSWD